MSIINVLFCPCLLVCASYNSIRTLTILTFALLIQTCKSKAARVAFCPTTSKALLKKRFYMEEEDSGASSEGDSRGSGNKRQRNMNHGPVGVAASVDGSGHVAGSRSAAATTAQLAPNAPRTRAAARAASYCTSGSVNVASGSIHIPLSGEYCQAHVSIQPC